MIYNTNYIYTTHFFKKSIFEKTKKKKKNMKKKKKIHTPYNIQEDLNMAICMLLRLKLVTWPHTNICSLCTEKIGL